MNDELCYPTGSRVLIGRHFYCEAAGGTPGGTHGAAGGTPGGTSSPLGLTVTAVCGDAYCLAIIFSRLCCFGMAWHGRSVLLNDRMSSCTPIWSLSRLMDKVECSSFVFMLSPIQAP